MEPLAQKQDILIDQEIVELTAKLADSKKFELKALREELHK